MRLNSLVLLLTLVCSTLVAAPNTQTWFDGFIFKNPSFTYELIRTLGYTYSGGADIGECVSTAKKIKDEDIHQWYMEWLDAGNRIDQLGDILSKQKNRVSSDALYLRASNYYRTASFYMDAPSLRSYAILAWKKSRISFLKAIVHTPYIRTVKIPYEKTFLPGYFISTKAKNAPLLIVNTGFDGTAEELYFAVGLAAHRRGYNVLLVEGPGQGELIKLQNLPFRYDWEHVVTPIIDFSERLPNIDRNHIALMGISMGGYLVARAVAFEPRVKAAILNGGVYDMSLSILNNLPAEAKDLLNKNPAQFNSMILNAMDHDVNASWFFNNGMWTFNVKTPSDVVNTLKKYSIANIADKIKCPTLVIDSVADQFFQGQPQLVYNALRAPKTLLTFSEDEAAEAHCQVGATAISNEKIFNWLDGMFNWHPNMIN